MRGILGLFVSAVVVFSSITANAQNFVRLKALDKYERTRIADLGLSIDVVASDSVYATVSDEMLERLRASSVEIIETFKLDNSATDFPPRDSRFHNYERMTQALDALVAAHPNLLRKFSIGKSVQGRELWCVQVNASKKARNASGETVSAKPGAVFMGNHHAREHVSAEIPLMLLEYLAANYGVDRDITALLDKRDVYIIPMVNPDGVEYDIATGTYRYQRKNMRQNTGGRIGVDLNRNYGYQWGGNGSSTDAGSDVYRGPSPFSEPETQAIKAFVEARPNLKVLLTYHTFSELILYPWGHRYEPIDNVADRTTFEAMGRKMADWNGYTHQSSSELYLASGDTTDWAYGALGIFAFTFELSPREMWDGGFYPGAGILDKVFQDNLRPALYMIDLADDPHRAASLRDEELAWLR